MLNQAYPAPAPVTRNLMISLLFGLFIGCFLIFFEPFNIDIASGKDSIGALAFFGFISTTVLIFFLYFLPLVLPNVFSDRVWKVKHQVFFCLIILLVIATFNGLYTNYRNGLSFSWRNYWWIINRTVVLGGIPFSFLILLDHQQKQQSNWKAAKLVSQQQIQQNPPPESNIRTITTDLKQETFSFDDGQFTHAIAAGNYLDLYFLENDILKSKTYRLSLSAFEKQLDAIYLSRCHRSYLVNLKKISKVGGNAQGLKLTLVDGKTIVPVSRKFIPVVKQYFTDSISSSSEEFDN